LFEDVWDGEMALCPFCLAHSPAADVRRQRDQPPKLSAANPGLAQLDYVALKFQLPADVGNLARLTAHTRQALRWEETARIHSLPVGMSAVLIAHPCGGDKNGSVSRLTEDFDSNDLLAFCPARCDADSSRPGNSGSPLFFLFSTQILVAESTAHLTGTGSRAGCAHGNGGEVAPRLDRLRKDPSQQQLSATTGTVSDVFRWPQEKERGRGAARDGLFALGPTSALAHIFLFFSSLCPDLFLFRLHCFCLWLALPSCCRLVVPRGQIEHILV
jgi:hypothetical protein